MTAEGSIGNLLLEAAHPATLADVIRYLETDPDLDRGRRREQCSAARSLCRALGMDPALVPAQPGELRALLRGVTAGAAGVSPARWSNIRSLTLKALKLAGIRALPGRYRAAHAPDWEALRSRLPDRRFGSGLSRFMSYCTAHEISPTEVDATTFSQFREAYENDSLLRDPGAMYRDTCVLWNHAVASIPGWPTLSVEVPVRRRDFALPVDHFPAAFGEDIARFLSQGTDPDVFSETYAKPIRPLTARGRRQHILMAATALVQSGLPPASITGLEVLVRIENAKSALRFLRGRAGGKSTGYIHHIATLLKTIARHYVRVDPKTVEEFRRLCSNLQPEKHGMTDKNKKCLRQFADEKKLRALILLPQRLMADAASGSGNHRRDGVQATLGLAIAIELAIPIRAQNLVGLRLDRHIHRQGSKVFLAIPAEETKNNEPIEAELPPKLTRLLDAYLEEFRPRLFAGASPWLFPGEQGRCRTPGGFAAQVSAVIAKMAGITITLHQFRHFAAKLYLDHQLGDYETVRKLLAHKSILTTQQFYWELDAMLARRRYADLLSDMVGELTRTPKAKPGHNRGRRGDV